MRRVTLSFLCAALLCSAAPPQLPKLSSDLLKADATTNVRVIVQWKGNADDTKDQKILNRGGVVNQRFRALQGGVYTLPASALQDLANDPDVAYISPDRPIAAKLDNSAAAVNASAAWAAGYTGKGIGVAVIDSGINPDPNLPKITYSFDFTNPTLASQASALFANGVTSLAAATTAAA